MDEDAAAAIKEPRANPEVAMQDRQKKEVLLKGLTQLFSARRQVIDLVYYHEKSIEEVAATIGIPQNTVKTRMFYARKQIADECPGHRQSRLTILRCGQGLQTRRLLLHYRDIVFCERAGQRRFGEAEKNCHQNVPGKSSAIRNHTPKPPRNKARTDRCPRIGCPSNSCIVIPPGRIYQN
jgi:predicted DNA-binding protein (UPF0251 family)